MRIYVRTDDRTESSDVPVRELKCKEGQQLGGRQRVQPIPRVPVVDEVARRLTSWILDTGLRPGDRMPSERELLQELHVGRSSLREAIKTLSAFGIIRVEQGSGMFVGDGSTSLLTKPIAWALLIGEHSTRDVIEARRTVEVAMAGMATERATPEDLGALEARLQAMRDTMFDPEAYTQCDAAFHLEVARISRNRVLRHVLETLRHIVRVWIYRTFTEYGEPGRSYDEHVPIVMAIKARDPEGAQRAMAAHLDAAAARLLRLVSERSQDR
jgi:GntR family transcriptional repressor for pyruvate dehydrogenase complex